MQESEYRKIIHVDMDAFFASVEQRDFPELRGKPLAVGGDGARGVVAAASYEARRYGVKSAMPAVVAKRLCPDLIFVSHRFDVYKDVSQQIREVFYEYTELVEPLSLDEAYLDVSASKQLWNSATLIAQEIKKKIKARLGLTASAGISYNKFLAKMASDIDKPDGLYVILPHEALSFLAGLPVSRFFGIGKATSEKMKKAGIFTGADLRKKSLEDLVLRYGKAGSYYYDICRGIDHRKVKSSRERKSVSAENTFDVNLYHIEHVHQELSEIAKTVFARCAKIGKYGRTVTVKIKYADFHQITRSITEEWAVDTEVNLTKLAVGLLSEQNIKEVGIRLLGVGVSNFLSEEAGDHSNQLTLNF